jgi:DNA replication protein DnaC
MRWPTVTGRSLKLNQRIKTTLQNRTDMEAITTNFKYESLEKFYGEFIRTRMEEMMTYIQFPGESRRLKNEVKTK